MSNPPDESIDFHRQLDELNRSTAWFGQAAREKKICDLLSRLASISSVRAIFYPVELLFYPSSNVQASARRTIRALISTVPPLELLHLNAVFESPYQSSLNEQWDRLSSTDLAFVAGDPSADGYSSVLGLASLHGNGYVRHAAVNLLSKIKDGSELPFLLIRQNDWVRQIAHDAQIAVADRIDHASLADLVKCLPLIIHLKSLRRFDHGAIVSRIVDILLDENRDSVLRETLQSSARKVSRAVIGLGLKKEGDHRRRVVLYGLESNDPVNRLACCRHSAAIDDRQVLLSILDKLMHDSFMPVRREAMTSKTATFPHLAVETWQRALLDPSFSIRDLARFHLARLGLPDSASFYRSVVLRKPNSLAAIEGLAETGDATDVIYFMQSMSHQLPSRRCAGIRGLSRVGAESFLSELVDALRDVSPRVVREARKTLVPFRASLPIESLFSVVLDSKQSFARRNALSLIAEMGKWRSTSWLLRLVSQAENDSAQYAAHLIEHWFRSRKVWTRPTSNERDEIAEALKLAKGKMSASAVELLEKDLARP